MDPLPARREPPGQCKDGPRWSPGDSPKPRSNRFRRKAETSPCLGQDSGGQPAPEDHPRPRKLLRRKDLPAKKEATVPNPVAKSAFSYRLLTPTLGFEFSPGALPDALGIFHGCSYPMDRFAAMRNCMRADLNSLQVSSPAWSAPVCRALPRAGSESGRRCGSPRNCAPS